LGFFLDGIVVDPLLGDADGAPSAVGAQRIGALARFTRETLEEHAAWRDAALARAAPEHATLVDDAGVVGRELVHGYSSASLSSTSS
jgi:hypothetical protein